MIMKQMQIDQPGLLDPAEKEALANDAEEKDYEIVEIFGVVRLVWLDRKGDLEATCFVNGIEFEGDHDDKFSWLQ